MLEALVDIGDLEDFPSNTIPGLYERLSAWLPSLIDHRCSYGERGGFLRRLQEGTWPAHILEHVTLELQNLAGMPGGFGRARETPRRGVYKVAVSAWHDGIARDALAMARELILAAMDPEWPAGTRYDVEGVVESLREKVDACWLGPSTACIVEAAMRRGIPSIRLLEKGNLVQLGYGARSQRIWTAETDRTPAIAEGISRDKELTKSLLRVCGIPVPEGRVVSSAADAWEVAREIGLPVVVKPRDGNHGRGVFIELATREQVEAAFHAALAQGSGALVESFIPGTEHRLLVVGGRLVAASRGDSVSVRGDGRSTLRELIVHQINSDSRRGASEEYPLNLVGVDGVTVMELARQGFSIDSTPPAGLEVLVQRNGNHAFDVTDEVHPSTAATAVLASRIVGLDIAGIDLVTRDISLPLSEQGGAIVEVNAGPGLLMHIKPAVGTPRPVGEAIVDHLFPDHDGRIPIVGVTGSCGKTAVAHLVARLLASTGRRTGLACSDGFHLGGTRISEGDHANRQAACNLMIHRGIEAAVCENGCDSMLTEGLAYDGCQVGIVTGIDMRRHYRRHGIRTPRQVFDILRTQVDVVLPSGAAVLNADEPLLVEMAALCNGEVIYFALDPESPAVEAHRSGGTATLADFPSNRVVSVRDGYIMLITGCIEMALAALADVPFLRHRQEERDGGSRAIEHVLAAVAAGWALGIPLAHLRGGIGVATDAWDGYPLHDAGAS